MNTSQPINDSGPVRFWAARAEARRVDDVVELQLETSCGIRMIWEVPGLVAVNLAHQVEAAFHEVVSHRATEGTEEEGARGRQGEGETREQSNGGCWHPQGHLWSNGPRRRCLWCPAVSLVEGGAR